MVFVVAALYANRAQANPDEATRGTPTPSTVEVHGRVFVRDTLQRVDVSQARWQNSYALDSARLEADYSAGKTLKATVEAELRRDRVRLRDVFVRVRATATLRFQVGRFKRPISAIALESAWRLPVVERGLLNDELVAAPYEVQLPFSGRAEGALVRYRPKLSRRVTVIAAVMNSRLPERDDGADAFDPTLNLLRDGYLRGEIELVDGVELAAGASWTGRLASDMGAVDQVWGGNVDVTWKHPWLRLWLELFYGQTPYIDPATGRAHGRVRAGRLLVAPRWNRPAGWMRRVELFGFGSAMDLSDQMSRDWAVELGGGATIYPHKRYRLQAHYSRRIAGLAYPSAGIDILYLQLGSAF